jgi:hypothetical protein
MFKDETRKNLVQKFANVLKKVAIKKIRIKFDRKRKTKR